MYSLKYTYIISHQPWRAGAHWIQMSFNDITVGHCNDSVDIHTHLLTVTTNKMSVYKIPLSHNGGFSTHDANMAFIHASL